MPESGTSPNLAAAEELIVLVPCLNEVRGVRAAATEVLKTTDQLNVPTRLILIDDGSTDGTRAAMEELAAQHSQIQVRINPQNLGMGRSVLETLAQLPSDSWVTVFPGDNEFLFSSIRNFLEVRNDYDLVLGYLHNPVVRTFPRRLASYTFTKLVSTLYGFPWRYLNGMKLYRARVFQGLQIVSSGHAFMAEAIAKAQLRTPDLRIGEVPFYSRGRGSGSSKAARPKSIYKAISDVLRGSRAVSRYRRTVLSQKD